MILLRHGQSEFNLAFSQTRKDPGIADPALTEFGHLQAAEAARLLASERIARIIVSPYTRTLQTAAAVARGIHAPVLINPIVRERCAFACDIGTPRTELQRAWPQHDFSSIEEIWWPAVPEPTASVLARAALFRAEMTALHDWPDTLVITHWGFIMSMTGLSLPNGQWIRCDPTAPAPEEISWRP